MREQFFGKTFLITLSLLALFFGLSILVFETAWVLPVMIIAMIAITGLTIWKPELGILIALAELFANSHGHLMSAQVGPLDFSSRMAVFVAVMLGWLVLFVWGKAKISLRDFRLQPFLILALAVILGLAVGAGRNSLKDVFSDGNAYFYVAYLLPILSINWTAAKRRDLLQVLAASATWIVLVTLGTLFIFTHVEPIHLPEVYRFLRDTRTAEITRQGETPIFRIFLQAQLSVLVMAFLTWLFLWKKKFSPWLLVSLSLAVAVLLISMSRSFAVGLLAGGIVAIGLVWWQQRHKVKDVLNVAGTTLGAALLGLVILAGVILFPWPQQLGSFDDLGIFASRAGGDVAISSRWNLLPPLMGEISDSPVFGKGFGSEVEFITDDPRIRAINPDGKYRTYSLEWGWQEIWLKMGLPGLIAFGWILVVAIRSLWPKLKTEQAWLSISLIAILTMLYTTHIFSPYLNHPLGLGLILFTVPFWVQTKKPQGSRVLIKDRLPKPAVQPEFIPSSSVQNSSVNITVTSQEG